MVFTAPEVVSGMLGLQRQPYGTPADIYAVGAVLNCAMGLMETPYGNLNELQNDPGAIHRIRQGIQKTLPPVIFSCRGGMGCIHSFHRELIECVSGCVCVVHPQAKEYSQGNDGTSFK